MKNKLKYYYDNSIRFETTHIDFIIFYYDKNLNRKIKVNSLLNSKYEIQYEDLVAKHIVFDYEISTKTLYINTEFDIKYGEYESNEFDLPVLKIQSFTISSNMRLYPKYINKHSKI